MDHLAVERPEARVPERGVLDDPLQLVHRDLDGVADRVPALDEHREAGDDVHQHALNGEADEDEQERGAG